jgi:hypothetical protein
VAPFDSSTRQPEGSDPERDAEARDAVGIDFGPVQDWVGYHLRPAQTASFQAFARGTQEVDLRPGRFAILLLICRNPGISPIALSRANGRDKSTLTPALGDLVQRGLITRTRVTVLRCHRGKSSTWPQSRRLPRDELTAAVVKGNPSDHPMPDYPSR